MIKRRDFLRGFIVAGVLMGINPESVFAVVKKGYAELKEPAWMKTIFCIFENPDLKKRIVECARDLDCEVFWGDPDSPDIIAVPYFIAIIDRGFIPKDWSMRYLQYCRETDNKTPLIVIDSLQGFESFLPEIKNKMILHLNPLDQCAIEEIIAITKFERIRALSDWRSRQRR